MSKITKHAISLLFLIFAVVINGMLSAQTFNYLTIGNMESEGWSVKNLESNAILRYEDSLGNDGSKALRTTATTIGADSYYVIIGNSNPLTLNYNEYYTISYWAKSTDAEGMNLIPWIQIADQSINYPFVNLQVAVLSKEWKKFIYTFSYPLQSSNKALIKFRVAFAGTLYLDNVQIGPADPKDIPVPIDTKVNIYSVKLVENDHARSIPVYKSDCPEYVPDYMDMQRKDNIPLSLFKDRSISWSNFSFGDSVQIIVEVLNENKVPIKAQTIRILPSRYNIIPRVEGNKIFFTLKTPGQFSVEIGEEGYKNGLMIFANPLELDVPDIHNPKYFVVNTSTELLKPTDIPNSYSGIYFKKGAYNIEVFDVPAHIKNIYLADSAWVYGALKVRSSNGVKIFGRGVLSQAKLNYRQAHSIDATVDSVIVKGIVVADFKYFAVRLRGSYNEIEWVKVIGGWVYNCDGITAYANSKVSHCFIWANDDAIKVYLSNITWSDIVVWQLNNGGVIQMSWGRTEALNCKISRVDVLRAEWVKAGFNAALLSCVGNRYQEDSRYSIQKNWLIEDVVTENPVPIIFGITPDSYSANDVRNITLRNWNVKMTESDIFKNKIIAGNPNTIIDGFIFDNFKYNNVLLTKDNWLNTLQVDTAGFKEPLILPSLNYLRPIKSENILYPNPVEQTLLIKTATESSVLKVYSSNATLAKTGIGQCLDVSKLEKGIYMLLVDNFAEGKFIKN